MGRRSKPLELLKIEGKSHHITKKEIESRENSEIKLGESGKIETSNNLESDKVAFQKWKELSELYNGFSFVSSSDSGTIEQLCISYSEIYNLRKSLSEIPNFETAAILSLHSAIDRKMKNIICLEDRLFLNPLSKIKSIPKTVKEKKEEDPADSIGLFKGF